VAGVAVGAGRQNRLYAGVAPQAALVVFKILNQDGEGDVSDGIEAVNQTIAKRIEFNIRILNLSLEVPGSSNGRDGFSTACNEAVANGIVVVVAAGNYGPDARTIGAPAAATSVISVGAGADLGEKGFFLAEFSSRGPTADRRIKPDLWGPGVGLRTTSLRTGYSAMSGTSFSSPFVAGVVALMLEANPGLTPAQVKNILIITSAKWAPGAKSNEAGGGRLQAYQAVIRAADITTNLNPPDVSGVKFWKRSISKNETHSFPLELASTRFPVAITVVIFNYPAAHIELDLLSSSGKILASSLSFGRQVRLLFKPPAAGLYELKLEAKFSNTSYLLDVSSDLEP
jgi:serine protease AprX